MRCLKKSLFLWFASLSAMKHHCYRVVFFSSTLCSLNYSEKDFTSLVYQDLNVRNRGRYEEGETWRLTETYTRRRLGLGVRRSRCLWVIKIRDDPFSDPSSKGEWTMHSLSRKLVAILWQTLLHLIFF